MDRTYSIFCEQGEYQIMMCKIYLSFNQLTSVNTPPPARLAWRQTLNFGPAGLEENFRDRMSHTHCIFLQIIEIHININFHPYVWGFIYIYIYNFAMFIARLLRCCLIALFKRYCFSKSQGMMVNLFDLLANAYYRIICHISIIWYFLCNNDNVDKIIYIQLIWK